MHFFKKIKISNTVYMLIAGVFAVSIAWFFISPKGASCFFGVNLNENRGVWTLITAIVSAPVAFVVWHLRDQNATQQIANSRKDTNLKEFQKLAEWVSGVHLVEEKVSIKKSITKGQKDGGGELIEEKFVEEKSTEFTLPPQNSSMATFSKQAGAVGLQIAAVYNLLPFYRGDHSEDFKRPALNLLLSAWEAMQRELLNQLEDEDNTEQEWLIIEKLRKNGRSPLGIALTNTLLAEGGSIFRQYITQLSKCCLAGMDFRLMLDPELGEEKNVEFCGLQFSNFDFRGAIFHKVNFNKVYFIICDFSFSTIRKTNFNKVMLSHSTFVNSEFDDCCFEHGYYSEQIFYNEDFKKGSIIYSKFDNTKFWKCKFNKITLSGNDFSDVEFYSSNLNDVSFKEAGMHVENTVIPSDNNKASLNVQVSRYDKKFKGIILEDVHFSNGGLWGIEFENLRMHNVSFKGKCVLSCDFRCCNIHSTTFKDNVVLEDSRFYGSSFLNIKGLNSVINTKLEIFGSFFIKSELSDELLPVVLKDNCVIIDDNEKGSENIKSLIFVNEVAGINYVFNNLEKIYIDVEKTKELNGNKWELFQVNYND